MTTILWRQSITNFLVGQIQLTYSQKSMKWHCDLTRPKSAQAQFIKPFALNKHYEIASIIVLNALLIRYFLFIMSECLMPPRLSFLSPHGMEERTCWRWDNLSYHKGKITEKNSYDKLMLPGMRLYWPCVFCHHDNKKKEGINLVRQFSELTKLQLSMDPSPNKKVQHSLNS